jgi:hypothetical protein
MVHGAEGPGLASTTVQISCPRDTGGVRLSGGPVRAPARRHVQSVPQDTEPCAVDVGTSIAREGDVRSAPNRGESVFSLLMADLARFAGPSQSGLSCARPLDRPGPYLGSRGGLTKLAGAEQKLQHLHEGGVPDGFKTANCA